VRRKCAASFWGLTQRRKGAKKCLLSKPGLKKSARGAHISKIAAQRIRRLRSRAAPSWLLGGFFVHEKHERHERRVFVFFVMFGDKIFPSEREPRAARLSCLPASPFLRVRSLRCRTSLRLKDEQRDFS
jgi:hypothetical protein